MPDRDDGHCGAHARSLCLCLPLFSLTLSLSLSLSPPCLCLFLSVSVSLSLSLSLFLTSRAQFLCLLPHTGSVVRPPAGYCGRGGWGVRIRRSTSAEAVRRRSGMGLVQSFEEKLSFIQQFNNYSRSVCCIVVYLRHVCNTLLAKLIPSDFWSFSCKYLPRATFSNSTVS